MAFFSSLIPLSFYPCVKIQLDTHLLLSIFMHTPSRQNQRSYAEALAASGINAYSVSALFS